MGASSGSARQRMGKCKRGMDAREDAGIRGETGDGDAEVVVDADELLLVARELARRALRAGASVRAIARWGVQEGGTHLEAEEDGVGVGAESDAGRALLYGLEGVLDLRAG